MPRMPSNKAASSPARARAASLAWAVLGYDALVAAWGAYVRATGSGAGCGSHWPLCNGEVLVRSPRIETIIELSHRVSSGFALVLTFAVLVVVWRAFPPRHIARTSSALAAAFMVTEALLGAALVLLKLVEHNASLRRGLSVGLHLGNTFFLMASTALTAWWASGQAPPRLGRPNLLLSTALGACLLGMIVVGASGAVTALGDTLFPPSSLGAGLAQDFAPGAHVFVRLRTLHPLLAGAAAVAIVVASGIVRALRPTGAVRALSRSAVVLVVAQVGAGLLNVTMLAPIWLQLLHLVLAYALWVVLVLTAAAAVSDAPRRISAGHDPKTDPEAAPSLT
jgi:heme A synthase